MRDVDRHDVQLDRHANAGALVTTNLARGRDPAEKLERILDAVRRYAGNPNLDVDAQTFDGEIQIADRNRAAAYLMRSQGMLDGDVEAILSLYLRQCSIMVTCRDVAVMGATLANGGVNPVTGERVLARSRVRDVLSVLYTCGMYDFAGEWAFEVGVPAAVPGKMGIAVLSPGLDAYGNSVRGTQVCREISGRLGLHTCESEDAILRTSEPEPPALPRKLRGRRCAMRRISRTRRQWAAGGQPCSPLAEPSDRARRGDAWQPVGGQAVVGQLFEVRSGGSTASRACRPSGHVRCVAAIWMLTLVLTAAGVLLGRLVPALAPGGTPHATLHGSAGEGVDILLQQSTARHASPVTRSSLRSCSAARSRWTLP
jgi:Glutaminase